MNIDEARKSRNRLAQKRYALRHPDRAKASYKRYKDILYFGNNRELVIQRDGEKCLRCGMTRLEHKQQFGRDITVDHINGLGRYVERSERDNRLENLQTLCIKCHVSKDRLLKVCSEKTCRHGHPRTPDNLYKDRNSTSCATCSSLRSERLYEERKAKGLCTRCGKTPHIASSLMCDYCRIKRNKLERIRIEIKRKSRSPRPRPATEEK